MTPRPKDAAGRSYSTLRRNVVVILLSRRATAMSYAPPATIQPAIRPMTLPTPTIIPTPHPVERTATPRGNSVTVLWLALPELCWAENTQRGFFCGCLL